MWIGIPLSNNTFKTSIELILRALQNNLALK